MENKQIRLGLTEAFDCGYLPDQKEQLLLTMDRSLLNAESYDELMALGFRRSGNDVYRPHCPLCSACQSLRILTSEYQFSRNDKRTRSRNQDLQWRIQVSPQPEYYELYSRYVSARHRDGSMYPPDPEQFAQFSQCDWLDVLYLEAWLDNKLVCLAMTDLTPNGLSAMYTLYDPKQPRRSLGKNAILQQIELAKEMKKPFLYLGYYIGDCNSMAYKKNFMPHEVLQNGQWQRYE